MSASSFDTEVIVIGAGVSGCAAAIALRNAGVEVTLVEKSAGRPRRFCGEFISGEAPDSLRRLDAWAAVRKVRRAGTSQERLSLTHLSLIQKTEHANVSLLSVLRDSPLGR